MSRDLYAFNDKVFNVIHEYTYTGHPESFTLTPGTYLMICYGARGGNPGKPGESTAVYDENYVPLGGLAMGDLTLNETTTMYAVVGGDGVPGNPDNQYTPGGYNGGGNGGKSSRPSSWCAGPSGGGATDIRLNNTPESIVTTEVTIPDDYTALEYITSTQGEYFDTGYIPKTSTTIEIDYEFVNETWGTYHNLFGTYNTQRGTSNPDLPLLYAFCLRAAGSDCYRIALPGGFATDISGGSGADAVILNGRVIFNFTEVELTWHVYGSQDVGHSSNHEVGCASFDFERCGYQMPTLYFFGQHKTEDGINFYGNNSCPGKLHSFTITEDGTDVHKFIPCKRNSDNQYGFYDVCTNTFTPYNAANTSQTDVTISNTIEVHTKQMNSLMSRIIVAAGSGGGKRITGDWVIGEIATASGGGPIGGVPLTGYNAKMYSTQDFGSYFGRGQNGIRRTGSSASAESGEGDAGGGGGWYGGYTGITWRDTTNQCSGGGGGSSYVLTANSYKPPGYIPDSRYYFTKSFMDSSRSHEAKALIAKQETNFQPGDVIPVIGDGEYEKISLPNGTYRLTCDGAGGAQRYMADSSKNAYGGHSSGTLTLSEPTDIYATVGGCPYYAIAPAALPDVYHTRFPVALFNGGAMGGVSNWPLQKTASGGASDIRTMQPNEITEIRSVPDGYTEVEYIRSISAGSYTYLDTGYIQKAVSRFECDCLVSSSNNNRYAAVYGGRHAWDNRTHVFFARFESSWYPCYGCNSGEARYTTHEFTRDARVTIATEGSVASWYDENGALVGSWTHGLTPVDGDRNMWIVGCNTDGVINEPALCTLYSFKIYESGEMVGYMVPCTRDSDNMIGAYDIIREEFYPVQDVTVFVAGDPVSDEDKTIYEYTHIVGIAESLLSRIIVAGGAGGGGNVNRETGGVHAGYGGGDTGGWDTRNSEYGTNPGPGTQTGSPAGSYESCNGGFGYGGTGAAANGGYGGSGGGGWYGGGATFPDGSSDDDRYGCGGSGYVLTANSYKPTGYIPDEKFYLTDTTNVVGGNVDLFGSVTVEVYDVNYAKILMEDTEGVKTYDSENDEWVVIPGVETITDEILDEYGVNNSPYVIGIVGDYSMYTTDAEDELEGVKCVVVPNTLYVSTIIDATDVDNFKLDCDNFDENIQYTIHTMKTPLGYQLNMTFDMLDVPSKEYDIYGYSFISTLSTDNTPPIEHEKVYKIPTDLMKVGEYDVIPRKNHDYIPQTLLDGTTTITSIPYVCSKVRKRVVYTLMNINNTHIRLTSFNMFTRVYNVIFEVPLETLELKDDTYIRIGDFVINDNEIYISKLAYSFMYCVSLTDIVDPSEIVTKTKITISSTFANGGQLRWVNDESFMYFTSTKCELYNTRTHEISKSIAISSIGDGGYTAVTNNYYAVTDSNSTSTRIRLINKTTETVTSIGTINSQTVIASDGDKLYSVNYVANASCVVTIFDGEDSSTLGTFEIPISNSYPTSIDVSNNTLYITFKDSMSLYICKLKSSTYDTYESFVSIGLPVNLADNYPPTQTTRQYTKIYGTTLSQYFFFPYYQLMVINYDATTKYNMGYKYEQFLYQTNSTYEESYAYNPTFITFMPSYMYIHTGEYQYEFESYSGDIKVCHIENNYRKLVSLSIIRKED